MSATGAIAAPSEDAAPASRSRFGEILRSLGRDYGGILGVALFALLVITALFAPLISPHDPLQQNLRVSKMPPAWTAEGSWSYPLGTDNLGRDLFSRIVYGTRVSLTVGLFGVLIATTIGVAAGLIAGYVGGRVDSIIMAVVNLILGLPYLLFVVVIAAIFGRSLLNVILIFGITDSPLFVRVARGQALYLRESVYVLAARSIGVRSGGIILSHILPNMIGPMITVATFEMSAMIFYEAGLGFLGLSVPPSVPSWGNMLATGRQYLTTSPWIATFPGAAIMIASLAMNLMGDWLRNALDPRMRGRRS
jgi:ABC-type dipeptide/oligopeptide/nickel transport system permease subunit